jgi:hypothetical protein
VSEPQPQRTARAAATESLISNLVGIAVVVGVSVLLARRDWLIRQAMAVRAAWMRDHRRARANREVAEFRRSVSDYEHGGG